MTSINKCRMSGTYQAGWETYKYLMFNLWFILVLIHPLRDKGSRMSCWWHRMEGNNVLKKLNILQSFICSFSYWNPQWWMYILYSSHLWMTGGFRLWRVRDCGVTMQLMKRSLWLFKHRCTTLNHFTSICKVG